MYRRKLGLLEIGRDPDVLQLNDGHETLAGLYNLAGLYRFTGHDAVTCATSVV
jgi:hypothetical protein